MDAAIRDALTVEVRPVFGIDEGNPFAHRFGESLGDQQRRKGLAAAGLPVQAEFNERLLWFGFPKSGHLPAPFSCGLL